MKLVFNADENLRKLVVVHQTFGPPDSPFRGAGDFASLISQSFLAAVETDAVLSSLGKKERREVWRRFLEGGDGSRSDSPRIRRLRKLLGKFELPLDAAGFRRIRRFSAKVSALSGGASSWVRRIFGKPLPDEVTVIPFGYPIPWSNSGTLLTPSPVAVGMTMGHHNYQRFFDVLLHEILHGLVKDQIKRDRVQSWFEEALLDYFAPQGILSEKIGLIKRLDLDELRKRSVQGRGYAAEESEKLFPVIKKYYPVCGKKTIWEFLRENGFGNRLKKR